MPVPITAPMPSAVMPQGPSDRRRLGPLDSSGSLEKSDLRANNCLSMSVPLKKSARYETVPDCRHAEKPATLSERAFGAIRQVAVMAAVKEVHDQTRNGPTEDQ